MPINEVISKCTMMLASIRIPVAESENIGRPIMDVMGMLIHVKNALEAETVEENAVEGQEENKGNA